MNINSTEKKFKQSISESSYSCQTNQFLYNFPSHETNHQNQVIAMSPLEVSSPRSVSLNSNFGNTFLKVGSQLSKLEDKCHTLLMITNQFFDGMVKPQIIKTQSIELIYPKILFSDEVESEIKRMIGDITQQLKDFGERVDQLIEENSNHFCEKHYQYLNIDHDEQLAEENFQIKENGGKDFLYRSAKICNNTEWLNEKPPINHEQYCNDQPFDFQNSTTS